MKLLIVVPILYREWNDNVELLYKSLSNFNKIFGENVEILIVVQESSDIEIQLELFRFQRFVNFELIFSKVENTSHARNIGIRKAKKLERDFILFHDASLYYNLVAVRFFAEQDASIATLPSVNISFSAAEEASDFFSSSKTISKNIYPIKDTFIWRYLFKVGNINEMFDINIGPGNNTVFKSGEDVLFFYHYLNVNCCYKSSVCRAGTVFHPPRPKDLSKHVLYASGQGYLFKLLISKLKVHGFKQRFVLYLYFCLFMGNSFFRVLTFQKSARKILILRLKGLFY